MGVLSNRISREVLKGGDHIYSWRAAYTYAHHGIYTGDGNVIHFTRGHGDEVGTGTFLDRFIITSSGSSHRSSPQCDKCTLGDGTNGVVKSCLDCFLNDGVLYRFEYDENPITFLVKARGGTCTLAESDTVEDVLYRANFLLENGFGCYHIFRNNCEDFAMYCKTGLLVMDGNGIGRSGQAASFLGAPLAAVLASPMRLLMTQPLGIVSVSVGVYCFSRYVADLGVRRDVNKVAVEDLVTKLRQLP